MSSRDRSTPPWEESGVADADAARAQALLRAAAVQEPLDEVRLRAVRARLGSSRRFASSLWTFRAAVALGIVLALSTLVVAATRVTRWVQERRAVQARVVAPPPAPEPRRRRPRTTAGATPATVGEDEAPVVIEPRPVQGPPVPPVAAPAPPKPAGPRLALNVLNAAGKPRLPQEAPAERPSAETTPPPLPAASPLADESELLAVALRALRKDHDPRGALRLFEEHGARFPAGPLTVEANLGRAEALLQLHRSDEALAVLDPMALPSTGRRRDLLVTRGELRALAGRCAEALIDFGLALTGEARDDAAVERALYGRATCRARLGDADRARADLESYLTRFPEGRFVRDARAMLQQGTP